MIGGEPDTLRGVSPVRGGGFAETAGVSQYGAAGSTSHVLQANTSFVVLDPKGGATRS